MPACQHARACVCVCVRERAWQSFGGDDCNYSISFRQPLTMYMYIYHCSFCHYVVDVVPIMFSALLDVFAAPERRPMRSDPPFPMSSLSLRHS